MTRNDLIDAIEDPRLRAGADASAVSTTYRGQLGFWRSAENSLSSGSYAGSYGTVQLLMLWRDKTKTRLLHTHPVWLARLCERGSSLGSNSVVRV